MKSLLIEICVGLSCHLLGAQDLIEAVESLPPGERERIELCEATCLGSCGKGPNARINGVICCAMTPGQLLDKIEQHFA